MNRLTLYLIASIGFILMTTVSSFADIRSTRNFYAFTDRLLTTGQPDAATLKNASRDGIEAVVNLVPPSESVYNPKEGDILRAQGIEYIHIPISWREPKPAGLAQFMAAMRRLQGKKVLIHCWSNARASAFAYAYRVAQAPKTRNTEWNRLRKVWSEVAGYDLDRDAVWQAYLKANVAPAQ